MGPMYCREDADDDGENASLRIDPMHVIIP